MHELGLAHAAERSRLPFLKFGVLTSDQLLPFHSSAYGSETVGNSPTAIQPVLSPDELNEIPLSHAFAVSELLWSTDQVEPFHVSINR